MCPYTSEKVLFILLAYFFFNVHDLSDFFLEAFITLTFQRREPLHSPAHAHRCPSEQRVLMDRGDRNFTVLVGSLDKEIFIHSAKITELEIFKNY